MANLTMADSIRPSDLLPGYDAYLGYVDGMWPTYSQVKQMFPGKDILSLTVLGGNSSADGCDCETGDLTTVSAAAWAKQRLAAGAWRPVIYSSVSNMASVIAELSKLGVSPGDVRLLSAHYGAGQHICGPSTCKLVDREMDGTQWTDSASGAAHSLIDASLLQEDFFDEAGTSQTETWEDTLMATIPEVESGSTGQAVKNWQGLLVAHGYSLGDTGQFKDGVDGDFGAKTKSATEEFQTAAKISVDGVVGPETWTAALS